MSYHFELPARQPFDLHTVIFSHGWIRLAPFQEDQALAGLRTVHELDAGRVVELSISPAPGGVAVETAAGLSSAEQVEVAAKVHWMLGLDQDFSAFYAACRHEPKLAQVEATARGRVLRSPTLFEDVVKTILTTNTAWSGTIGMARRLVAEFGAPLPEDPSRRAFPTPARLAEVDADTLRTAAKLGYRAPYVLALAQAVASGALDLEALKTADLPTLELRKRLLSLQGVGPYAAANLLMILGRSDFIPIDSWALKMVSQEWHGGQPVSPAEVEAAFAHWGPWKGLAYWFWDWTST